MQALLAKQDALQQAQRLLEHRTLTEWVVPADRHMGVQSSALRWAGCTVLCTDMVVCHTPKHHSQLNCTPVDFSSHGVASTVQPCVPPRLCMLICAGWTDSLHAGSSRSPWATIMADLSLRCSFTGVQQAHPLSCSHAQTQARRKETTVPRSLHHTSTPLLPKHSTCIAPPHSALTTTCANLRRNV